MRSPLADCVSGSFDANCEQTFKELKNPYYLGDEVGLTQSLGWVGAWTSEPSVNAVAAKTTRDVVAAVNFARTNNLRLVVKGGGHSYQGTSNAANSLLIWTRHMNAIVSHDAFVGAGCTGIAEPQPAVSIEPGAYWQQAYDAVNMCWRQEYKSADRTRLRVLATTSYLVESCRCAATVGRRDSLAATGDLLCPLHVCAVRRRRVPVGASPTRQTLQPEATGAVMEVTKWLKPSV